PLAFGMGASLAQSAAWRGRAPDITGYICLGARHYNPETGSFLSSDPVWNSRDPNYFTFAGGDPVNGFDPDGRVGKALYQTAGSYGQGIITLIQNTYYSASYGVSALAF